VTGGIPASVVLATAESYPLTPSDAALGRELAKRGARVTSKPWDAIPSAASNGSIVVLRSTWDYHRRSDEFRRWVQAWERRPAGLWNPPSTVLWNMDKIYLRELADRGIPIPRTRWLEPGERPDMDDFLAATDLETAVVKPRISATAWGTRVVRRGEELAAADLAPLLATGSLIQEFVPEIQTVGELSLVFFSGRFSHAFIKRAVPGDFRVQVEFGGSETFTRAARPTLAFAGSVLLAARQPYLYARVDIVETSRGPVLMELELIEPALCLDTVPGAAARFAEALLFLARGVGDEER
jgi:glutathione synthase/RimK-type ligase-like ATP-grasp enzyme